MLTRGVACQSILIGPTSTGGISDLAAVGNDNKMTSFTFVFYDSAPWHRELTSLSDTADVFGRAFGVSFLSALCTYIFDEDYGGGMRGYGWTPGRGNISFLAIVAVLLLYSKALLELKGAEAPKVVGYL